MNTGTQCLLSFTTPPENDTTPTLRRIIGHGLGCSPFQVHVTQLYRVGERVLVLAMLPFDVATRSPNPGSRPVYCRPLPRPWTSAQGHKLIRVLSEALRRLGELHEDPRRRRVFLGRPLVVAAENCADHVKLYRFTRTDWAAFAFANRGDSDRSYMFYLFTQQTLGDLLRLTGRRLRMLPGAGHQVVFGDAVSQ